MKLTTVSYKFVEFIPARLEEGIVYISTEYTTAVHLCADGCGNKVVTPLSPVFWNLMFDGETVSLAPSIGNFEFPCRSHYWIKNDRIEWDSDWSEEQVEQARQQQLHERNDYYDWRNAKLNAAEPQHLGILKRIKLLFKR